MTLTERFLRYVAVDTQSEDGMDTVPSTAKQRNLAEILCKELIDMGASDVTISDHSYVYATVPSNMEGSSYILGLIAHMDTSNAVSGANVKPIITENYNGEDIKLANGVLSPKQFPSLLNNIGKTIISSDGTTLLGADDKAGVAIIMTVVDKLINSDIKHGTIKVAFTPDEEVGRGTDFFDVDLFGCDGAYTVDGGQVGELEFENFNAASVSVIVNGCSVHPGSAKGAMVNASLVLMELQSMLPVFDNPMYTEGYEGFYHLTDIHSECEHGEANYIIRDHDMDKFVAKKQFFASCIELLQAKYGCNVISADIEDSYYNMKQCIMPHYHLVDNAVLAMTRVGIDPIVVPIRGGTDGARLSYMGLPCPNLFTGGYNFHGRFEYIPAEDMFRCYETVLNIVDIYKNFVK